MTSASLSIAPFNINENSGDLKVYLLEPDFLESFVNLMGNCQEKRTSAFQTNANVLGLYAEGTSYEINIYAWTEWVSITDNVECNITKISFLTDRPNIINKAVNYAWNSSGINKPVVIKKWQFLVEESVLPPQGKKYFTDTNSPLFTFRLNPSITPKPDFVNNGTQFFNPEINKDEQGLNYWLQPYKSSSWLYSSLTDGPTIQLIQ